MPPTALPPRTRPIVALLGGIYHADAARMLREHADVIAVDDPQPAEVRRALEHAQGALVRYPVRIDEDVLRHAPRLCLVASSGRGTDSIDVQACTLNQVAVMNNPGLGTRPVSEHALTMMLALSRRLFECSRAVREPDIWQRRSQLDVMDLQGRTLGIVGLGLIGSEMARKCTLALGMQVLAYDPYVSSEKAERLGVRMVGSLAELLPQCDVVSMHCELNDETRGMIGEAQFRLMKPTAFLVNTSRGKVVQQAALVNALSGRLIAGAALDVFEEEPLTPDCPLFTLPNVILSPHIAGLSNDALYQLAHSAVTQLLAGLRGEQPAHLVNPAVWEAASARL
jgi:D-3-phosphoglycerate dehydrogenase/microcystin synthetase protein McyI